MFDLKIRPIKRVVEGRANFGGSSVLVTVTKRGYRFAINGPSVFRTQEEWTEFSKELNAFLDKATEIAREL